MLNISSASPRLTLIGSHTYRSIEYRHKCHIVLLPSHLAAAPCGTGTINRNQPTTNLLIVRFCTPPHLGIPSLPHLASPISSLSLQKPFTKVAKRRIILLHHGHGSGIQSIFLFEFSPHLPPTRWPLSFALFVVGRGMAGGKSEENLVHCCEATAFPSTTVRAFLVRQEAVT